MLPPVYAKFEKVWKCFTQYDGKKFALVSDEPLTIPSWIQDCDCMKNWEENSLCKRLKNIPSFRTSDYDRVLTDPNVMYCLVVWVDAGDSNAVDSDAVDSNAKESDAEDSDAVDSDAKNSDAVNRDCLSGVQIYVGKAEGGVHDRWLKKQFSHCWAVDEVLKAKKRYRENKLYREFWAACKSQGIIPADCFLALAHMRGWKTALFVFPCDKDKTKHVEGKWQEKLKAKSVCHGLNCKQEGKFVGK